MDHMEFSIALPHYVDLTSAGGEWASMKQRLSAHINHSSDSYHQNVQGLVKAFLINIAAEQVQEVFNMFGLSYEEAVKFNRVLQRLEDVCLPRFLIIYNRFKFFTSRQAFNQKFDDFLRDLLNWSDFCEFGDLKDILVKDCIITGISDDSVRQNLLKTEELDLAKTVNICRAVEKERRVKTAHINTDSAVLFHACVGTDNDEGLLAERCKCQQSVKHLIDASTNVTDNEILPDCFNHGNNLMREKVTTDSVAPKDEYEEDVILSEFLKQTDKVDEKSDGKTLSAGCETTIIATGDEVDESSSPPTVRRSKRHRKPFLNEKEGSSSIKNKRLKKKNDITQDDKKLKKSVKILTLKNGVRSGSVNHTEEEEGSISCSNCSQKFKDEKSLKKHMWEIHKKSQLRKHSLKCRVCKLECRDQKTLRIHRLSHKGEKKFQCETCSAKFGNPSHLKVHMRLHTGERPFTCDTCGASFPESSKLKAHMRRHTGEKPYQCKVCSKTFAWTAAYTRHLRTHTGERPYTCEFCGGNFADFTSLQRHRRTHTNEKPYKCEQCEACFSDPSGLKLHKRTHTGERPYSCETCGASFARSQHLKEHTKLHTGEKPFECETCGAKFVEASKLTSHRRKHTGEKPYVCKVCGTSFAWTAAYTRHMRTHTLEKPYVCDFCGIHYADHSTLTRHRRTHTGERPYPCKVCGSKFADNSSLHRHMRIHTGEKSYTCEVCGSSFAVKSYLVRHMRTHTGEKPYGCDICGSKFTDSSKLKRHKKIHEKGKSVRRVKGKKEEEPLQHFEQFQPLQPLQHLLDEEPAVDISVPADHQTANHQSLTLTQDMQHPVLVTTTLLPLTVLPFNSSVIS